MATQTTHVEQCRLSTHCGHSPVAYKLHMPRFLLTAPGPRPPYFEVAKHLWGSDCDYDSDGNSDHPEARDWTELTLSLRSDRLQQDRSPAERVDVDPVGDGEPLVLAIVSDHYGLARRAAEFLFRKAGGELTNG